VQKVGENSYFPWIKRGTAGNTGGDGVNTLKRVFSSLKQLFGRYFSVWHGNFSVATCFFFRCLSFYNKIFSRSMCYAK